MLPIFNDRLGSFPIVPTMQATDSSPSFDLSRIRRLNPSTTRRSFVQPQVGSVVMVIVEVSSKEPAGMRLAKDDRVIEAFSFDGADDPFAISVLPRRSGRDHFVFHSQQPDRLSYLLTIDSVSVS